MIKDVRKIMQLKKQLKGTGCFIFEKGGTYFLYREVEPENQFVLKSKDLHTFIKKSKVAAGVKE